MFVAWLIYLVLLIIYFEDPPTATRATAVQEIKALTNSVESTTEENEALLGTNERQDTTVQVVDSFESEYDDEETTEIPLWRNIPVMTTFVVYFVLKLVLECLLSSTATLTEYYFHWGSSISGIYLAVLGLLMLPANFGISILAGNHHDDKELIFGCEVAMLVGCCGIIQYTSSSSSSSSDDYSPFQYVIFSVIIFLSTNAMEGPNMSLLSKTIPKSWSRGIFNVGLLATEAGTLGRAVGDLLLSVWGFQGLATLLNDIFRAMSILSALALAVTLYCYEHLEPREK
jgi:hypothetical protein